jgi:hypothetical protein
VRRADASVNVSGMHVRKVHLDALDRLVVTVETNADVGACPGGGVVTVGYGRRVHEVADAPCFAAVNDPPVAQADSAVCRGALSRGALSSPPSVLPWLAGVHSRARGGLSPRTTAQFDEASVLNEYDEAPGPRRQAGSPRPGP